MSTGNLSRLDADAFEQCDFCEIDGKGNHAPRCPVHLERELTAALAQVEELRHIARQTQIEKEAAESLVDVLRRIDQSFGCNHADQGADDADNIARHVNELFDERDTLRRERDRTVADFRNLAETLRFAEAERDEAQRQLADERARNTAEAPCTHEWYQGMCVHCETTAKEFRDRKGQP